jgi:hypothetical protein
MSWHTTNPGDLAGSWSARPGRGCGASGQEPPLLTGMSREAESCSDGPFPSSCCWEVPLTNDPA